jgi:quercetin dioxygenase-like cupin family protein
MATHHANPGEIVDLQTWAADLPKEHTKAIVKTGEMELIRIVLPAGKGIPNHNVPGPITIQCVSGKIAVTAMGTTQKLNYNQLIHLIPGEPHSLKAIEDSVVLFTIIFSK